MLSFQTNPTSQDPSLLSVPTFLTYPSDFANIYGEQVERGEEPVPNNCSTIVSLSLAPLTLSAEEPRCGCQFFQSESLTPTIANERSQISLIGALSQSYSNNTSANEMLTGTTTFDCPSTIRLSQSGFLAAASSSCGLNEHDVVCSRGKAFYNLPGNVRFRKTIRSYIPMYLTASSKMDKSVIIDQIIDTTVIVDAIHGSTRFLKYHSRARAWSVMGYDQVRDKVGHALREAAYDMERENKIQSARVTMKLIRW